MPELIIGMLVGALILLIGFALGRTHRPGEKDPAEICGCTHSVAFHDSNGCHFSRPVYEKIVIGHNEYAGGDRVAVTDKKLVGQANCACPRYVGPHSSYVPELDG